jgi:Tfp pilus assembly protein PilO
MSWISRPDRLWSVGGAFVTLALLLLTWTFLVGPQRARTDELTANTSDVLVTAGKEQRRLDQLTKEFEALDAFQGELAANRMALPFAAKLADFLRELQAAGDHAGVTVTSFAASNVNEAKAGGGVLSIMITIGVEGTVDGLAVFLNQLQQTQPRAVLIVNSNLEPGEGAETLSDSAILTIAAQIFMAAPANPEKAAPATSAAPTTD